MFIFTDDLKHWKKITKIIEPCTTHLCHVQMPNFSYKKRFPIAMHHVKSVKKAVLLPKALKRPISPHQHAGNICLPATGKGSHCYLHKLLKIYFNQSNSISFNLLLYLKHIFLHVYPTFSQWFRKHIYSTLNQVNRCTPFCSFFIKWCTRVNKVCDISNIYCQEGQGVNQGDQNLCKTCKTLN